MSRLRLATVAGTLVAFAVSGCSDLTSEDVVVKVTVGATVTEPPIELVRPADDYPERVATVLSPSSRIGGTLRMAHPGKWDSLDPAGVSSLSARNFVRNYGRALVAFRSAPGAAGAEVVPDLAETLGLPSRDFKTWTYRLRKGVKYEDGSLVTSKDVKYAIERSFDSEMFPSGSRHFRAVLDLTGSLRNNRLTRSGLRSIKTPDSRTIVFSLARPFSGFDYYAQLPSTIPVPRARDTGSHYAGHVLASGPYKFESNVPGRRFVLVRNPHYAAASDPDTGRNALPDRIEVELQVDRREIDRRLLLGDLDLDLSGGGVGPDAQAAILADPRLKATTDVAQSMRSYYTVINPAVPPFDRAECRKAVVSGADKTAYQAAYGGEHSAENATSLIPPAMPGAKRIDLYAAGRRPTGHLPLASRMLSRCLRPDGFAATIAYRADDRQDALAAESLRVSLARVGVRLTLKPLPERAFRGLYTRAVATNSGIGLIVSSAEAEWPEGFAFFAKAAESALVPGREDGRAAIGGPAIDDLVAQALKTAEPGGRERFWTEIDRVAMENALAVPGAWGRALLFRSSHVTNVFVSDAFGMYDYTAIGTNRN